jgi:hypothetical protein
VLPAERAQGRHQCRRAAARRVARVGGEPAELQLAVEAVDAWEKKIRSARGFKRVGRHSEYAI